jgi:hypothetical protein
MKLRSWRPSTDRIVSLSAMAVGIGSLFVILYQTHLMRQAQYASAMPYLMVAFSSNTNGVHVTLRNAGIGPALIEDVRVHYQGRTTVADPHAFYLEARPDQRALPLSVDRAVPGRLIPPGEGIQMLGVEAGLVTEDQRAKVFIDLLQVFDLAEVPRNWLESVGVSSESPPRAVIEIIYSSVYGQRWRLRSNSFVPEPL